MLPLIFDIGKIAGRQIHFIPDFVVGLHLLTSFQFDRLSIRLEVILFDWPFCHIDSLCYILLFTFFLDMSMQFP